MTVWAWMPTANGVGDGHRQHARAGGVARWVRSGWRVVLVGHEGDATYPGRGGKAVTNTTK